MSPTAVADQLGSARAGDRVALARLISRTEAGGTPARELAALAYRAPAPWVVGITGAPGAGKSTLTDALVRELLAAGFDGELQEVAVICVDPTSPFSGGAILGDRIRMQGHATDARVFIRSMASRGHLGGLALAVPDAVRALGAAGFTLVLVETVGVGQLEVEVAATADTVVVVTTPGTGDSTQANKAGLLEVADLFVINKADRPGVREARRDLEQMLDLGAARAWRPPVLETVAARGEGVAALRSALIEHRDYLRTSDEGARRDIMRAEAALGRAVAAAAKTPSDDGHRDRFAALAADLAAGRTDPYAAADELLR